MPHRPPPPLENVIVYLLAHLDWLKRKIRRIMFVVFDLLSLKFVIRLIIAYFGTLRLHQIAPFFLFFSKEHNSDP